MDNHLSYEEFRTQYEKQHPASIPQIEYEVHEYQAWVRWAVFFTFVCAAMVSGIHTVPTVWQSIEVNEIVTEAMRTVVAYASLFAIELAILLSAYLMAKGVKLAYFVMVIASLVAVLANLYSVGRAFDTGGESFALVVSVALGIGAPMIALFSGKMFVDIHRADRIQDAKAKRTYKEACIAWDSEIEKAWKGHQKGLEKRENSRNFTKSGEHLEVHESSRTSPKPRVKIHEIAAQVRENGDEHLSVSELMQKYDISQGSTTKIRDILRSKNGHLN